MLFATDVVVVVVLVAAIVIVYYVIIWLFTNDDGDVCQWMMGGAWMGGIGWANVDFEGFQTSISNVLCCRPIRELTY